MAFAEYSHRQPVIEWLSTATGHVPSPLPRPSLIVFRSPSSVTVAVPCFPCTGGIAIGRPRIASTDL
eukprot:scaffold5081_cov430-Prasinococcus_capsulatus_cf.AAC.3